jgi:hypothetical protein
LRIRTDLSEAMVHIDRVDLTPRGIILPSDRVGMVIVQPHLHLTEHDPFRCLREHKDRQLAALQVALDVAILKTHGADKTHFTILPEYSIPGLEGVAQIEARIATPAWPAGTIVIGGVDALAKVDLTTLAGQPHTYIDAVHNALDRMGQNEWANCSVTWTKATDGTIEKWIQPKLSAAWPEETITYNEMFRGNSIFAFKGPLTDGTSYRFSTLLCFDWVGAIDNKLPWLWALEDLEAQAVASDGDLSLSWFFVIQCNDKPSHPTFLNQVPEFFRATRLPRVRRDRTCLVFANCAGKAVPGPCETFGGTSLIFTLRTTFSEETSRPTVSKGGERFRRSTLLGNFRDAYFREKGACIHSFIQVNPDQAGGADARAFAVEHPFVFPIEPTLVDPRAPSDIVPACVKWVNDELDRAEALTVPGDAFPLAPEAAPAQAATISQLRKLDAEAICNTVTLSRAQHPAESNASGSQGKNPDDADLWEQAHIDALNHVVQTLTLMRLATEITIISGNRGHAALAINDQAVDLVAVRGRSHRDCSEHLKTFKDRERRKVLIVSRDRNNSLLDKTERSFLHSSGSIGQDQNITDPHSGRFQLDYQTLLQLFRASATKTAMLGDLNAKLAA